MVLINKAAHRVASCPIGIESGKMASNNIEYTEATTLAYENVEIEIKDNVLVVSLKRPEKLNAISHQMRVDLLNCVRDAAANDKLRAIVITGDGKKAFSAGADIPELRTRTLVSEMGPEADLRKELPTVIERLNKPTIAAINGYCFGAGMEIALGCTVRIASTNAELAQPEITLGQIPGSGGTQRLARFVGMGWAMQMILSGEPVNAQTASRIGLVTEVLAPDELVPRAIELAQTLGSRAPLAFVAGRDSVLRSTEMDLLSGIDYEKKLYAICMASEDGQEGLAAYDEKREPVYKGR